MLCSEVLDKFLLNQRIINNSSETIKFYKKRIGYFIDFVNDSDVTTLCLDNYNNYVLFLQDKVTDKGNKLSSYTIKTTLNAAKIFIKYCYDNQFIIDDFYKKIKPYKNMKKSIVVLSDGEIQKLLSTQNEYSKVGCRNLLVISLMLDAGLRVSEVSNLKYNDVNIELDLIRVLGKGNKERLVPLTESIKKYFLKYTYLCNINSGFLILDFENNANLSASGISQILRRIKKEYNFKELHPHYLRHTFATLFLVNGGDPVHLQLILGHTTLFMTEQYLHLANQMTLTKQKKYSPLSNIKKPQK